MRFTRCNPSEQQTKLTEINNWFSIGTQAGPGSLEGPTSMPLAADTPIMSAIVFPSPADANVDSPGRIRQRRTVGGMSRQDCCFSDVCYALKSTLLSLE